MIRSVLLIASTTLIAGVALAPAAGAGILGPDSGVTAARSGAIVDVRFTPAALATAKLRAGTTVSLECTVEHARSPLQLVAVDEADQDGPTPDLEGPIPDETYGQAEVGAGGVAHIRLYGDTPDNTPGVADTCDVLRVRHLSRQTTVSTTVARIALTPAGAASVDETTRANALRRLLLKAHAATGYLPVAALGAGVVAMDSTDAAPPAGQTGYWTDGTHAAVATLSAAGRRLVIEDAGDAVLRTNVFAEMDVYGVEDDLPTDYRPLPASTREARSPDADRTPSPYKSDTPLMPADGIRMAAAGRRVTARFTERSARTLRALRGRRVVILCQAVTPPRLLPSLVEDYRRAPQAAAGVGRVPAHGDTVSATLKGGRARDVCDVIDDAHEVAFAGATAAGRTWTQDLSALLVFTGAGHEPTLAAPGGQSYLPTDQIVKAGRKDGYVAMSGPEGVVPVGRVGVWTDGARQAAIAVQSASGHRFLDVDEGNGLLRSNLASTVSALLISETFAFGTTSGGSSPSSSGSGSSGSGSSGSGSSGSFSGE